MRSYLLALTGITLLTPTLAISGPTFDVFGVPESVVQMAEQGNSLISAENSLKKDTTKLQNVGEAGKLKKENVQEPQTVMKEKDTAPFTSQTLAKELAKKNPSVPSVEAIFKKEFYIDSKSIYADAGKAEGTSSKKTVGKNTVEQFQQQSHLTFENARAVAVKANQLTEDQDKDFEALKKDINERTSTSDIKKGISVLTYKSGAILNEIAILRNNYLEIESLNALQGTEQSTTSNPAGAVGDVVKGAVGL